VLVICNKVDQWLTGNLMGPLVINAANCLGQQVVLTEKKWTTRQPLLRLGPRCRWPNRRDSERWGRKRTAADGGH
jgi:hypothetical protein